MPRGIVSGPGTSSSGVWPPRYSKTAAVIAPAKAYKMDQKCRYGPGLSYLLAPVLPATMHARRCRHIGRHTKQTDTWTQEQRVCPSTASIYACEIPPPKSHMIIGCYTIGTENMNFQGIVQPLELSARQLAASRPGSGRRYGILVFDGKTTRT